MAAAGDNAPIIIKKVKKVSGGHHGGAWKVAYADFVTAMMAFFLLLWLLNATTDEQKQGIADYFTPASVSKNYSGGGGVLGGQTLSKKGVMRDNRSAVNMTLPLPNDEKTPDQKSEPGTPGEGDGDGRSGEDGEGLPGREETAAILDQEAYERLLAEQEERQFAEAEEQLRQAIESVPELEPLAENLVIEQTPEGLRIQIIDQAKYSMFPLGSADMYEHTQKLMAMVADAIRDLPQRVAIKGHTDAAPYNSDNGYSNWELSTDRANASRRALTAAGLDPARIARVIGRADQDPFIPEDPFSPQNRRISIILLREASSPAGQDGSVEEATQGGGG